jgi:hypothetical protein
LLAFYELHACKSQDDLFMGRWPLPGTTDEQKGITTWQVFRTA